MDCARCRKPFAREERRCPNCGEPNPNATGVFQTSTVLIATGSGCAVYRSVNEVPNPLREKLVKSTNSANSATILIADRRGRREIARVMRNIPGPVQRRLVHAIMGQDDPSAAPEWLTPARKRAILAALLFFVIAAVAFLFTRHL